MNRLIYNKAGNYTGWLGNLMFQVAATIGIAQKNGLTPVFADTGYFDRNFYSWFKGPFETRSVEELSKIECEEISEPHFNYQDFQLDPNKNYNLTGYFQSRKYWAHCEDEIRKMFEPKNIFCYLPAHIRYAIDSGRAISIHVRRGDYLNLQDYHTVLPIGYYDKAAKELRDECDDTTFLIFSDGIPWCRENFTDSVFRRTNGVDPGNIFFVQGQSSIQDLMLQSKCAHNVICNSSFSWWASYLNCNPDKRIVAPKKENWFGPKRADWVLDDLYEDNWILV